MARSTSVASGLHIMLALADGPRHGYAIKQAVEERTEGAIRLGPGTLYEALQRLEDGQTDRRNAGRGRRAGATDRKRSVVTTSSPSGVGVAAARPARVRPAHRRRARESASAQGTRMIRLLAPLLWLAPAIVSASATQPRLPRSCATNVSRRNTAAPPARFASSRRWPPTLPRPLFVFAAVNCARFFRARTRCTTCRVCPQPRKRTEMDTLVQDLRYAIRQFVHRPGFTAIAVLSLALAIGGNSLIYGMLDGFVFHPFPYPEPDRLVAVGVTFPKMSADTTYVETLSPAEYLDIRTNRTFAHVGSFDLGNRNISGGDVPERVFTALLLDDLFPVVGMTPALGRGFTQEELGPNGPPAAIISHRLWQSRFGGDPSILNRAIRISGRTTSVVGVMPPGLVLIGTDLWIPWGADPLTVPRNVRQFNVLARLAPGATLAQANAELETIARRTEQSEKAKYRGVRELATHGDALGCSAHAGRPARGVRASRCGRIGTAHCLRQPHQPFPRALVIASARARRAPGARRGALAVDATAAHRKLAARIGRRRSRSRGRVGGSQGCGQPYSWSVPDAGPRGGAERPGARVEHRARSGVRSAGRCAAGDAGHADRSARLAQGRRAYAAARVAAASSGTRSSSPSSRCR